MTKPSRYWFEVYQDNAGEWRWRLKAINGRIIADSAEGFVDRGNAIDSIQLVMLAVGSHASIQEKANDVIPAPKPEYQNPHPQGFNTNPIKGSIRNVRGRPRHNPVKK